MSNKLIKKDKMIESQIKKDKMIESQIFNNALFNYYYDALLKVCLSIFEWVNLPDTMDARFLEKSLFYYGQAAILKDSLYGIINTNATDSGTINIYDLPTRLNCYSNGYTSTRRLYTGLPYIKGIRDYHHECILVKNNWERKSIIESIILFATMLYECQASAHINVKAQKTPVLVVCDESQRATFKGVYEKYEGNTPVIFGDKKQLSADSFKSIKTDAPFVADKIMNYKKEIWNEFLTFLGINNLQVEKAERLIADEANANNELINLNLQSMFAPRLEACKQFNQKFNKTSDEEKISVRIRSDLANIIKNSLSIVNDYLPVEKPIEIDSNDNQEVSDNG